ncbi:hypothetical protein J6TS1_41410 [Siminovitchia terrae]|uniref:YtkA-like domain-containing protein n=1 Tax=Siminovitchia terrae TaxID=1914933 RepID=A0ABQ4L269_SIMTE|nr:FixH family protein [Siminovitchia terrae]GIN92103.1 hypothetical protein J22TS1_31540 [Siminovitchia terrae]GIN98271.1 hypothetical protein J6TS1_41410 [Siminovitchia terrae]
MKKRLWPIMIGLFVLVLAACGKTGNEVEEVKEDDLPKSIDAELEVQETANVGEAVPFKVTVTQGDEKVADADEVEFEIWEEENKEDSEMIKSKNNKDGTYEAEKSFDTDGVYIVQVHVTARGLHTMPKKTVTVGEGTADEEGDHDHGEHAEHSEHDQHDGDDHGEHQHAEGFSMHFMEPKNIEAGKKIELMAHLELENKPMEAARVRFEIWNDGSDKHEFVDAKESQAGEYTGHYEFKESGKYKVQVHVENDEGLHEHEEHEIEVK